MKKSMIFMLATMIATITLGQSLKGVRTIPSTRYPTIKVAVDSLNLLGVGTGGVTFNVTAGHTETSANIWLYTPTGSETNPVVFIKSGTGAKPLITAAAGTSATTDGIIKIAGTDYVTFDGIDVRDPVTNTAEARMEWGYAVLMASDADASQHITITNCSVTLQRDSWDWQSTGIYSMNHTADMTSLVIPVSTSGVISYCRIDNCTISEVSAGIRWVGTNNITYYGQQNYFGTIAGNTISNFGTIGMISVNGIYGSCQNNLKIANNNISTSGNPFNLAGIFTETGINSSVDVLQNIISLACTGGTTTVYGIYNNMGHNGTSNAVKIMGNTISVNYLTATYGSLIAIMFNSKTWDCEISNNLIKDCQLSATGSFTGIKVQRQFGPPDGHNWQINNNIITNCSRLQGVVGEQIIYGIWNNGSGLTCTFSGNQIYDNVWPSNTACYGMYISNDQATSVNVINNVVRNISKPNAVTNVLPRSGPLYGIWVHATGFNPTVSTVEGNDVYDLSNSWGGVVMAFHTSGYIISTVNVLSNRAFAIHANDAAVHGIYSGDGRFQNIFRNRIYDMQAAGDSGAFYGISTGSATPASETSVYNNYISDLRAPESDGFVSSGLNLYGTIAGTMHRYYNNTVYLDQTPTTGNPVTAAVNANTLPDLDMRNNILVNKSKIAGSGKTIAFWRSTTSGTTYSTFSNNNCLYAGIPGPANLLFYAPDFSTPQSAISMAQYRSLFPQEGKSFTELPPFINVTTVPFNLRLNAAVATDCESAASVIAIPAINTDYDNEPRFPNPGYPNSTNPLCYSIAPDAGADEFGGIPSLIATVTDATCSNTSDGAIDLTVNTGTSPYTFLWSNGATTQDITALAPGIYTVSVTDANATVRSRSWTVGLSSTNLCNTLAISGTATSAVCYNALQTITVSNFTVTAPGGHTEFIAGQNILFKPGTVVHSGAYLWGHITTTGTYCSQPTAPIAVSANGSEFPQLVLSHDMFMIYPNPTSGKFTLEITGEDPTGKLNVEIFSMHGDRVFGRELSGNKTHELSITDRPAGIYIIRVTSGTQTEVARIIRQ